MQLLITRASKSTANNILFYIPLHTLNLVGFNLHLIKQTCIKSHYWDSLYRRTDRITAVLGNSLLELIQVERYCFLQELCLLLLLLKMILLRAILKDDWKANRARVLMAYLLREVAYRQSGTSRLTFWGSHFFLLDEFLLIFVFICLLGRRFRI